MLVTALKPLLLRTVCSFFVAARTVRTVRGATFACTLAVLGQIDLNRIDRKLATSNKIG